MRRDFRHALRALLQAPGFTAAVALTLALGVGANVAIFSAIDAVLLRNAPVANPDTAVSVYTSSSDGRDPFASSSYPDYLDLRDGAGLAGLAAYASITLVFDDQGTADALPGEVVSGNYFDVLGVRLALGRGFAPGEDRAGSPVHVAVVSYGFWQRRLNGDEAVIGRSIALNGGQYTIVGVGPRGFSGPVLGRSADIWVPMALQPDVRPPSAGLRRSLGTASLLEPRGVRWLNMVGRLAPGSAVGTVSAGTDVIARRLASAYPSSNRDRGFTVVTLGEGPGVRASARPLLRLLGAAVALVLLVACANVASLLLVRAVSRQREVAVRMAIGAGRAQLVRQWLLESVLLAVIGSAGGLLLAWWSVPALHGFGIPETIDLSVNLRVLGFALAVAIASGLLFGMAPVLHTLHVDPVVVLRDEGRAVAGGAGAARMRRAFVVAQVALSLVLLVGAGLLLRTLQNAYSVELGYDLDRTLVTDLNLDVRGYSPEAGQRVYAQILEGVAAIPGVQAAGAARVTVLSGNARTTAASIDGLPIDPEARNAVEVRANVVSHDYLAALGVPVLHGRDFSTADRAGSPKVAIVSRALAQRLWPGADPLGRRLVTGSDSYDVIGVVPDAVYRSAVETDPPPFFYGLLAQNYESGVTLHVRTVGDPLLVFPAIRQVVREVNPLLVLSTPLVLRDVFDRSVGDQRLMATLVGLFGSLALALAGIGLYGVMAHLAALRQSEMGIRMALGARPRSILTLLLGEGLRLVVAGGVLGLLGAFAGTRFLESQLFGVASTDLATFASVCLLLFAVGLLACVIPAGRAMRTDPASTLRQF